MKIAMLIPDGVGVRNFVLGRFLRLLEPDTDVEVFHTIPEAILPKVRSGLPDRIHWQEMLPYRPNRFVLTLQYSLSYAQMYWADTVSMRRIRNASVSGSWRTRLMHKIAKFGGKRCASPGRMRALEKVH